jgi:hypothetical protein
MMWVQYAADMTFLTTKSGCPDTYLLFGYHTQHIPCTMSRTLSRPQRTRPATAPAPRIDLTRQPLPFQFHHEPICRSRTGLRPTLQRKQVWPPPDMLAATHNTVRVTTRVQRSDSWNSLENTTQRWQQPCSYQRPKSAFIRRSQRGLSSDIPSAERSRSAPLSKV